MKSSEVSIKTRSTPASLTIQGQVTKDTTVKWSIHRLQVIQSPHIIEAHERKWASLSMTTIKLNLTNKERSDKVNFDW